MDLSALPNLTTTHAALQDLAILASIVLGVLAYRRAGDADRRDREAVIAIQPVWEGRRFRLLEHGPELPPTGSTYWNKKKYPHEPDEHWVIAVAGANLVEKGVEIRKARDNDNLYQDEQNNATWRVLLEITNHGRSPATNVRLTMRTNIRLIEKFDLDQTDLANTSVMTINALGRDKPRYIELRSLQSLQTTVTFVDATSGEDGNQPVQLTAAPISFQPRT